MQLYNSKNNRSTNMHDSSVDSTATLDAGVEILLPLVMCSWQVFLTLR